MLEIENGGISRRTLLGGFAAALGAGATGACSIGPMNRPSPAFSSSARAPLGIQLYTLGADAYRDLPGTFAQLAEMGYREVELPQVTVKTAASTAAAAGAAGLTISSLHLNSGKLASSAALTLDSAPAQIVDAMGMLGTRLAVLPMAPLPASARLGGGRTFQQAYGDALALEGRDYWHGIADLLNSRAATLAQSGIGLGYHNHNMEFAPIDGTTGWALLVERTEPRLVHFEVDVGWVQTAGLDPAALIHSLGPRVRQLHLKDVAAGTAANFALETKPAIAGAGVVDWPAVLRAARAAGVEHAYVEQEPPFVIPRIEAARQNADFFKSLVV
jgi:sugar phosphate isomerase/epimerase